MRSPLRFSLPHPLLLLAAPALDTPRAGDDASDVRWASLDELAALDVNAEAVAVLERAAALRGVANR
jgi:hypothetical protein